MPVIRYGTEPECAAGVLLGHLEDMVDGAHHGFRRAEIGVQRVVPSSRKKFPESSYKVYGGKGMIYFIIFFGLINIIAQIGIQMAIIPTFK